MEEQNKVTEPTNQENTVTFTQAQVDEIVKKRLQREREHYSDYEELKDKAAKFDEAENQKKSELERVNDELASTKAELESLKKVSAVKSVREKVAAEMGVPANLLHGEDEESCKAEAEAINSFIQTKQPGYPAVKDGGESRTPKLTKEDILKVKNEKERLRLIEENYELFKD